MTVYLTWPEHTAPVLPTEIECTAVPRVGEMLVLEMNPPGDGSPGKQVQCTVLKVQHRVRAWSKTESRAAVASTPKIEVWLTAPIACP